MNIIKRTYNFRARKFYLTRSMTPFQGMPISTQRKLRLLVLLQKKYFYTCKNIVTKPNLEEFLCKHFEHYIALKIVANNIEHVWQLTGRGKKVKFPRIFRGKFVEKSADYTGNFRGETSPRINQ